MRIKFRVWDKDLAKFLEGCERGSLMAELSEGYGKRDVIIKQICPGRYVFELWTGMVDKNGKKVYEGDVVKGEMGTFEIKWYEEIGEFMFVPNLEMKWHPAFNTRTFQEMEVVGNIHEGGENEKD